jgi:hypothetical protein
LMVAVLALDRKARKERSAVSEAGAGRKSVALR